MKVVSAADWRSSIPFETPVLLADLVPGEPARCVACGGDAEPRPRDELWAYKHRHPRHHDGYVRFYCRAHTPAPPQRPAPVESRRPTRERAPARERTPARPTIPETTRAMCPDCFVEVSATGVCGMCARQVV